MTDYQTAAKELGFPNLYPWQDKVLAYAVKGGDLIMIVKTAGGKSLIYIVLIAMDGSGLTIVVSPFRALQEDQVKRFCDMGLRAVLLNSDFSAKERREVLEHLDEVDVLFLAPEQLAKEDLRDALEDVVVNRVVLDEAHTLPQSQAVFRPAFGEIGSFIDNLPRRPQVIACTATATKEEREEIIRSLGMRKPETFTFPVRRENLHLFVKALAGGKDAESRLLHAVADELDDWNRKGCAIVYCNTVSRVKALVKLLKARGYNVAKYTGKMKGKARRKNSDRFMSGEAKVMVATSAFGVGIDKANILLLIQAGLPLDFSMYVQEVGRAGRDGRDSRCVLYYTGSDQKLNEQILRTEAAGEDRRRKKELQIMQNYVKSGKCRWKTIEKYFGEKADKKCGCCDNCIRKG